MQIKKLRNHNLKQTLNEIERLVRQYYIDVKSLEPYNIYEIFDYISKTIKFKKDPDNIELVLRPKFTMRRREGDCDDKTVLFLSWLKRLTNNVLFA